MFNDQYCCVYHGKFTAWFNDQKMAVKKFANTALNGKLPSCRENSSIEITIKRYLLFITRSVVNICLLTTSKLLSILLREEFCSTFYLISQ